MISQINILLHNIRSSHNVGAIFRTADGAGISKIYISGYTPAPIDRFGRARKDIAKASLGAEKTIAWENTDDSFSLIKKMKKAGVRVIGLEQNSRSIDYRKIKEKISDSEKVLIIVGNEVGGIEEGILDLCDFIAEIPMHGSKESLNVSIATGILLYSLL